MNRRRIVICVALIVLLPFLVGFLEPWLMLLFEQRATPAWVQQTRVALSWVLVILVYTWLAIVQRDRLLLHVAIVALSAWLFGEAMYLVTLQVLDLVPGVPQVEPPGYLGTALRHVSIDATRAVIGTVLGLVVVGLRGRSTRPVT
jgi:hypothetical protein